MTKANRKESLETLLKQLKADELTRAKRTIRLAENPNYYLDIGEDIRKAKVSIAYMSTELYIKAKGENDRH